MALLQLFEVWGVHVCDCPARSATEPPAVHVPVVARVACIRSLYSAHCWAGVTGLVGPLLPPPRMHASGRRRLSGLATPASPDDVRRFYHNIITEQSGVWPLGHPETSAKTARPRVPCSTSCWKAPRGGLSFAPCDAANQVPNTILCSSSHRPSSVGAHPGQQTVSLAVTSSSGDAGPKVARHVEYAY